MTQSRETETIFGKGIPAIPMVNSLKQYATANGLRFDSRWETLTALYKSYNEKAANKN